MKNTASDQGPVPKSWDEQFDAIGIGDLPP